MFGSDWPVCRLAPDTDYPEVLKLLQDATADLKDEDKASIFHGTAVSYYGLQEFEWIMIQKENWHIVKKNKE